MKKALMIASMASMLDNFNSSNIEILDELGYEILNLRIVIPKKKSTDLKKAWKVKGIELYK